MTPTNAINECERISIDALHKFQRLDSKRQKVMLEKMDVYIDTVTDADIKEILTKLKVLFRRKCNEN